MAVGDERAGCRTAELIPDRATIHSSVVARMLAMSSFETTLSGRATPQPRIAQPLPIVMRQGGLKSSDWWGCAKATGVPELPSSHFESQISVDDRG